MVRFLELRKGKLDEKERDKLAFWFAQAGMWGRYSGTTEGMIDQDLTALDEGKGDLNALLNQLRQWRGYLRVEPDDFNGATRGARFYPVLYMLTRMGDAKDWGNGLSLKANMLGKNSSLDMHHIFPKAQLRKQKYKKMEINALGNFCFQTKEP